MEKISKRKAVFRVEFDVFSCDERAYEKMCSHLELMLRSIREQSTTRIYSPERNTIEAMALVRGMTGIRRLTR